MLVDALARARCENTFLLLDIATGNLNGDTFPDVVGIGTSTGAWPSPGRRRAKAAAQGSRRAAAEGSGRAGLKRLHESRSIFGPTHDGQARRAGRPRRRRDRRPRARRLQPAACAPTSCGPATRCVSRTSRPVCRVPTIGNTVYAARVGRFVAGELAADRRVRSSPTRRTRSPTTSASAATTRRLEELEARRRGPAARRALPRRRRRRLRQGRPPRPDDDQHRQRRRDPTWATAGRRSGVTAVRARGGHKGHVAVGDVDGDRWIDIVVVRSRPRRRIRPRRRARATSTGRRSGNLPGLGSFRAESAATTAVEDSTRWTGPRAVESGRTPQFRLAKLLDSRVGY